jgi:hypothetical protein
VIAEAEKNLEQIMADGWHATPIDYDNVRFINTGREPFIRLQIEWSDAYNTGVGRVRNVGYVMVSIYTPKGAHIANSGKYADDINKLYQRATTIKGLTIMPGKVQRVGDRKQWYQRNLLVPFFYDVCTDEAYS